MLFPWKWSDCLLLPLTQNWFWPVPHNLPRLSRKNFSPGNDPPVVRVNFIVVSSRVIATWVRPWEFIFEENLNVVVLQVDMQSLLPWELTNQEAGWGKMTLSLFSSSGNTSLLTPLFFQTLWRLSDKGVLAALAALNVQYSIIHALADYSEAPSKEIHSNWF